MTAATPANQSALGMVSTRSFPAVVGTADMMLKSSGVTLVGFEKTGSGHCTVIVRGNVADVRIAVEAGAETAEQFGQLVGKTVIPRPMPNLDAVLPICPPSWEALAAMPRSPFANQAVGLLETVGFPAMVGAADAMLKGANVRLAAYETIGDGLCTAIVRGSVADVGMAIQIGMAEAERIGQLHAVMVIPRALEDLERALPLAEHWQATVETRRAIPIELRQVERKVIQPVALPELQRLEPVELPMREPQQLERFEERL
ncbi:MAG TPA: BMC domain-containing protein [Coleofasciculaceae cyanobacterium]